MVAHIPCYLVKDHRNSVFQGETDVKRHVRTKVHVDRAASLKKQPKLKKFIQGGPIVYKTSRTEVLMTNFTVEHSLPTPVADKCGPVFKSMFPESEIAKNY